MILPYLDQQPLYNASNVTGYPGWATDGGPEHRHGSGPGTMYDLDWANTTLAPTSLAVFVWGSN